MIFTRQSPTHWGKIRNKPSGEGGGGCKKKQKKRREKNDTETGIDWREKVM